MRLRFPTFALVAATMVLGSAVSARADGPSKEECIENNAKAQSLRNAGKWRESKPVLVACGNASCPAIVRDDCQQRLDELQRTIPTIVFDVKDAHGADVTAVKISFDGQPLVDHLDGTSIAVDPGDHTLAFESVGYAPLTKRIVVREGDKSRLERVELAPQASVVAIAPPVGALSQEPHHDASPSQPDKQEHSSIMRPLGLVIAGIGLAAIGTGIGLGVAGNDVNARILTDCPSGVAPGTSTCTNATEQARKENDRSATSGLYTGAIVATIAGSAFVVGGAIMFFAAPRAKREASTAWRFVPSFGPSGAGFMLDRRF